MKLQAPMGEALYVNRENWCMLLPACDHMSTRRDDWSQQFHSWVYIKKSTISKRYMHSNVHSSIIYNNQDMELT